MVKVNKASFIGDKIRKARIPICAQIELTNRCNLSCVHCYVDKREMEDLDPQLLDNICIQLKELGTRYINLTGGEPLAYPYFKKTYEKFSQQNFLVTVLTNATLIDDQTLGLFRRFPPHKLSISIYGADNQTYFDVTQKKDAFDKLSRIIEKLIHYQINFELKTFFISKNLNNRMNILNYVKSLGDDYFNRYSVDYKLVKSLDDSRNVMKYLISPKDAVDLELLIEPNKRAVWSQLIKNYVPFNGFSCGCGYQSFAINTKGIMSPCTFLTYITEDLNSVKIKDAWIKFEEHVHKLSTSTSECSTCRLRPLCFICPSITYRSQGLTDEIAPDPYQCELAKERFGRLEL